MNDETKLFVAEADTNAVAVFNLSRKLSGAKNANGIDRIAGRIPVEWYPSALLMTRDSLFVSNGKGTRRNPRFHQPDEKMEDDNRDYARTVRRNSRFAAFAGFYL